MLTNWFPVTVGLGSYLFYLLRRMRFPHTLDLTTTPSTSQPIPSRVRSSTPSHILNKSQASPSLVYSRAFSPPEVIWHTGAVNIFLKADLLFLTTSLPTERLLSLHIWPDEL